jgi:hypothetical protein
MRAFHGIDGVFWSAWMTLKFATPLSGEPSGNRLETEINRLYGHSDIDLARAILNHARHVRNVLGMETRPEVDTYLSRLLLDVVPELAHRLGETIFLAEERDRVIHRASDFDIRCWTWTCIRKMAKVEWVDAAPKSRLNPWAVLTRDPVEGNPLAFAADRIAPITCYERLDGMSKHILAAAKARGVEEEVFMWSPSEPGKNKANRIATGKAPARAPRSLPKVSKTGAAVGGPATAFLKRPEISTH